ncbi:MAG: hypothetical protein DRN29_09520 [Thermoplasmata archaeon]|nr:MAG: hypothetical protein DRN29_09520 [Thermoplasmata archaeon]
MNKIRGKALFIAILMVALVIAPLATTGNAEKGQTRKVTCYLIGKGERIKNENELSVREAEKLIEKVKTSIEVFKPLKGKDYLTDAEEKEAENMLNELLTALHDAGLIPNDITPRSLGLLPDAGIAFLHPILSCGTGCSYIPLYPGEAFLGVMLRPIFLQYFIAGYTGCFNVKLFPPRIEYWDWVGTQTVMVFGFVGLYIDFGSIGIGLPPVQVLIGESLFTAGIDWL